MSKADYQIAKGSKEDEALRTTGKQVAEVNVKDNSGLNQALISADFDSVRISMHQFLWPIRPLQSLPQKRHDPKHQNAKRGKSIKEKMEKGEGSGKKGEGNNKNE